MGQSAGSHGAQQSTAVLSATVIALASMLNCEKTKARASTARIGSHVRLTVNVNFFIEYSPSNKVIRIAICGTSAVDKFKYVTGIDGILNSEHCGRDNACMQCRYRSIGTIETEALWYNPIADQQRWSCQRDIFKVSKVLYSGGRFDRCRTINSTTNAVLCSIRSGTDCKRFSAFADYLAFGLTRNRTTG